jgi:exopolyphosphatase/guanosine-5'-triphosphate,3'-diphosphate pyrophosphatase
LSGEKRIAVVDIGSNTANLAIFVVEPGGSISCVAERDQPLQLLRRLGPDGHLPAAAIAATMQLLRDFVHQATTLESDAIELISTSAVRDAPNSGELVARVKAELGLTLRVLDGADEARTAVVGVVNTLPLIDGFVVDLGGGSLQITEVENRRATRVASLPLGALRMTDQFVRTDPPDGPTVNVLRRHVQRTLETLPWLKNAGGHVVGVGGTIRTLAKMSRRAAEWPIPHGHGYRLTSDDIESSWELVSRADAARRRDIPGLPAHRVDLVIAGALVVKQLLRTGGFDGMEVSSSGVREGAALMHLLGPEARVADIREAGLRGRFGGTPEDLAWASRARTSAEALFDALATPLGLDATLRDTFAVAARLRALWERRSPVPGPLSALLERPIQGFFQREVLAVADLVSPVPRLRIDLGIRARLAVLLDLVAAAHGRPLTCVVDADAVRVGLDARVQGEISERFGRVFGRPLVIGPFGAPAVAPPSP